MTVEPNRAPSGKAADRAGTEVLPPTENIAHSQSLYRKWRSQTFSELVGQEAVTRTLQNAIASGRVGHAYLFCGPRGTGKTSSARLLAKALNCTHPNQRARPCNQCAACEAIVEGRAMDLIEIDAASNRGIDEIRSLRDTIGYQPSQFRYKFYIIDEVHMLTEPAFNALLKTLEEPPPHAIFVLATTDPQDIPATVVSRCQRFDFQRINLEQIAARLSYICQQEEIEADSGALELIARQATGSLRDALSLLDQLIVFSGGLVTIEAVRAVLGVMNSEAVAEFVNCLLAQDLAGGLELINRLVQSGTDLKRFNREVVDHLRSLMLIKANPGSNELTDMTQESLETLRDQASHLDLGEIVGFLKIFSGVDYNLKVSPYGQLPLEIALMEAVLNRPASVQMAVPPPRSAAPARPSPMPSRPAANNIKSVDISPESEVVGGRVAAEDKVPTPITKAEVKRPLAFTPEPPPAARVSRLELVSDNSTDEVTELSLEVVQTAWSRVVEGVGVSSKMAQALLLEARPVAIEGHYVTLAFKWEFHHKQISQDPNRRAMVENAYSDVVGQKVLIRCILEKDVSGSVGSPSQGAGESQEKPARSSRAAQAAQKLNARILE
ncbi:MAG: DNA polymerase III subunit gamma/tau [Chloroflexota bacterium]|nr:DNA polymerase III subunit gamma/tau [Chloroflexota bacterium]